MASGQLEPTAALNAALAEAQGEFPVIERTKTVQAGAYTFSYAPLYAIFAAIQPALTKNGLAVTQLLEQENGRPALRTELRHKDGGILGASFPLPNVPESPQQLGSLVTYIRRYALVALLGIAAEEDDDGQQASGGRARPDPHSAAAGLGDKRARSLAPQNKPAAKDLTEPQRKKIYALRGRLTKHEVFTQDQFDRSLGELYGVFRISELSRDQANNLIERLEAREKELPAAAEETEDEQQQHRQALNQLLALYEQKGINTREARLEYAQSVVGRPIRSSNQLTLDEIAQMTRALEDYGPPSASYDPSTEPFPDGY